MPKALSEGTPAPVSPTTGPTVFEYRGIPAHYDEMLQTQSQQLAGAVQQQSQSLIRPAWQKLFTGATALGSRELQRRSESAGRILQQNGITYNVYSNQQGSARTWDLDVLPMMIDAEEWKKIEAAVIQRATLLNQILGDCYTAPEGKSLIHRGLLSPSLLYSHPAFLRSCHGIQVNQNKRLVFYAVDLARSPDGQWWVLSDRTQAPSGSGYALENRIVMSRVMPDLITQASVQRLSDFFRTLRHSLASLAPHNQDKPRVVLLTPGPFNETYFEHAYLARSLGYTLAQGEDLTVRDNSVYLKTLEGLRPVDVILRRVDDDFCDPLELRSDSFLGVPGLVQAVRAGNVTIANALGSGLIQNPALLAFLPSLCRELLSQELLMPSVATWWCGQESAMKYVFNSMDRLVIKPIIPSREGTQFGSQITAEKREELKRKIQASPYSYVAQEQVQLSTAPSWAKGVIEPRSISLRVFAVADGDTYRVMPGGLTRVGKDASTVTLSMQRGGRSKDTWIPAGKPEEVALPATVSTESTQILRQGSDLPSRLADHLYWLGRYTERVEDITRILRTVISRIVSGAQRARQLAPCLETLAHKVKVAFPDLRLTDRAAQEELSRELMCAVFDANRDGSLAQSVSRLQKTTAVLRDRLSNDTWRILANLSEEMSTPESCPTQLSEVMSNLERLIMMLSSFSGMVSENMIRGGGWRFLDTGRRLERSVFILDLARNVLHQPVISPDMLEPLLEIGDSVITYRMRYFAAPQIPPTLDLLLVDENNPRSLAFQLSAILEHIRALPREAAGNLTSREEKLVLGALTSVRLLDFSAWQTDELERKKIEKSLDDLALDLPLLSDVLTRTYFAHSSALGMTERQPPVTIQEA